MNAPVIDQDIVHLDVRPLCRLALLELDESILQAVARLLVADHLAAPDLAKAREDELEVLALGHLVQLAHKQDILGRGHVGEGEVADHLERERLRARLARPAGLLELLLGARLLEGFLVADAEGGELGWCRDGRGWRDVEADGIVERVICDAGVGLACVMGGGWRQARRRVLTGRLKRRTVGLPSTITCLILISRNGLPFWSHNASLIFASTSSPSTILPNGACFPSR